ncbi:hypothetical protein LOK49_LG01G01635 [Camellia lanceoleosa]|uniref:Uncharacterized protein n=1 Tax=Camellia lanceoleosa TaxID=1840588 RepID=A0ACC0J1G2_9ERIC|nr:hypothetical protein LOK49_LG01G01635 [Camellia lanceoleosa]
MSSSSDSSSSESEQSSSNSSSLDETQATFKIRVIPDPPASWHLPGSLLTTLRSGSTSHDSVSVVRIQLQKKAVVGDAVTLPKYKGMLGEGTALRLESIDMLWWKPDPTGVGLNGAHGSRDMHMSHVVLLIGCANVVGEAICFVLAMLICGMLS